MQLKASVLFLNLNVKKKGLFYFKQPFCQQFGLNTVIPLGSQHLRAFFFFFKASSPSLP